MGKSLKRALLILLLLSGIKGSCSYGQSVYLTGQGMSDVIRLNPSASELKVGGSPYADEHWTEGVVLSRDSLELIRDHLRLNAYTGQMEIFNKGDKLSIVKPFEIDHVLVGKKDYIYSFIISGTEGSFFISSAYFELLSADSIELLRRYQGKIVNNSYVSNYMGGGGDGNNYYSVKSSLYTRNGNGTAAVKLPSSRRQLSMVFGDANEKAMAYIKENKVKSTDQEAVLGLFTYMKKTR